jgi:signal transduction histidine kinase
MSRDRLKKILAIAVLFLVSLTSISPVFAVTTLELSGEPASNRISLTPYIYEYVGNDVPNDARVAKALPESDYRPVGNASPLFPGAAKWFRFSIRNPTTEPRRLILDFDQALFNRIEWYSEAGTSMRHVLTGQSYPYATRDVDYDFFAFRLDIPAGETFTANFLIDTPHAVLFIPAVIESDRFFTHVTFFSRVTGAIMGMLYSVCLFMFFYLFVHGRSYLAQTMFCFAMSSMLSILYINGAIQRLLPDMEYPVRDAAYVLIHAFQGITFGMVLRLFYGTAQHYKLIDKCMLALMLCESFAIVLLPLQDVSMLVTSILAMNSILMLLSVVLAVIACCRRQPGTDLFTVGLLLFMAMTIVSTMGSLGMLPMSFMTRYGYELGLTLQVDFILLAVILQMAENQKEKNVFQSEMTRLNTEMSMRSRFVDQVTHDLKSPLAAVLGSEELLRDEQDEGKRTRFLDIIHDSSSQVVGMINDMLDHSSLQRGSLGIRLELVVLQDFLCQLEQRISAMSRLPGVMFDLHVEPGLPDKVQADPLRLSQLLTNLLINALKFTERGSVQLQVSPVPGASDAVNILFVVQDTGIGMSDEFLRRAFEPYSREETRMSSQGGFGLGLAICQQLVEAMGGTLQVESQQGKGTRFAVELPFRPVV